MVDLEHIAGTLVARRSIKRQLWDNQCQVRIADPPAAMRLGGRKET